MSLSCRYTCPQVQLKHRRALAPACRYCSRAGDLGSEETYGPFRKLLPPLGDPFAPGDHTGGDIDGLQV